MLEFPPGSIKYCSFSMPCMRCCILTAMVSERDVILKNWYKCNGQVSTYFRPYTIYLYVFNGLNIQNRSSAFTSGCGWRSFPFFHSYFSNYSLFVKRIVYARGNDRGLSLSAERHRWLYPRKGSKKLLSGFLASFRLVSLCLSRNF